VNRGDGIRGIGKLSLTTTGRSITMRMQLFPVNSYSCNLILVA